MTKSFWNSLIEQSFTFLYWKVGIVLNHLPLNYYHSHFLAAASYSHLWLFEAAHFFYCWAVFVLIDSYISLAVFYQPAI